MKLTGDFDELLMKELKDLDFALGYLNECLKDEDDGVFLLGLRHVAKAQGGIKKLAKKTKLNREHLFRMLSRKGNPRLETLRELARVFGWQLAFVPEEYSKKRKAA